MDNTMNLEIRTFPIAEPKGNLVAFASVNINDCFAVTGIKVMNGENGLFVAMPSMKDSKGDYRDICFPTTAEFRKELAQAVLDEYNATLEKAPPERASVKGKMQEAAKEVNSLPQKAAPAKGDNAR